MASPSLCRRTAGTGTWCRCALGAMPHAAESRARWARSWSGDPPASIAPVTPPRRRREHLPPPFSCMASSRQQIAERGARMARRDDREYREYLREEQRRQPGCPAREVVTRRAAGLIRSRRSWATCLRVASTARRSRDRTPTTASCSLNSDRRPRLPSAGEIADHRHQQVLLVQLLQHLEVLVAGEKASSLALPSSATIRSQ